jgi:glutamate-5-semialdehyde dehydrogenase
MSVQTAVAGSEVNTASHASFDVVTLCQQARIASRQLAQLGEGEKNQLLLDMADGLEAATAEILQ